MAKQLTSVFTDDMNHCFYTGLPYVERHHIFGGSRRKTSEKYGFVIPLTPAMHPNGAQADNKHAHEIDIALKQMAQRYYEKNYGTRAEFIKEFGKSYL